MDNKRKTIIALLIVIGTAAILLLNSYGAIKDILLDSQSLFTQQQIKRELYTSMYNAARERSVILLKMMDQDDPFELDELNQEMGHNARKFITSRRKFLDLELSDKVKQLHITLATVVRVVAPLQMRIAELLVDGNRPEASKLLFDIALPKQQKILNLLDLALLDQTNKTKHSIENLRVALKTTGNNFIFLGLILASAGLFTIITVLGRASAQAYKHLQKNLNERELHIQEIETFQNELSTQKKEIEENLTRLELLVENTSVGIWDWDIQSGSKKCNGRCSEILGYEPEELPGSIGQAWNKNIHPVDMVKANLQLVTHWSGENKHYSCEVRMKHKNGSWVWILDAGKVVEWDANDEPLRMIGTYLDISERYIAAEKLSYQASHDSLTGLINRGEFERRLKHLISTKISNDPHVLLYLDLDQFKVVNDTSGHSAGDELLQQIAELIGKRCRKSDTLARLGGDEFALILNSCEVEEAKKTAKKIINDVCKHQFYWDNKTFRIGVSIGMVIIDEQLNSFEKALHRADSACFAAKDAGRNCYRLYRSSDEHFVHQENQINWLSRIELALEKDLFELFAQPIVPINSENDSMNYELLIRMQSEVGSTNLPGTFLPTAERYDKMIDIDRWVIQSAISILSNNFEFVQQAGYVSINLSGQSLKNEDFLQFVTHQAGQNKALFSKLCFEITETAAIGNLSKLKPFLSNLRSLGVKFALDDFGSGLSSFGYLKNLRVDYLKIDGQFIKDIGSDNIDRTMVKSIYEMGSALGLEVVAEFVENDAILNVIKDIGINYAQGYGLGKPEPLSKVIENSKTIKNYSTRINL